MGNVEKLIRKLTDKKAETRKMAIIELGKLGDLRAVDPLITRLKDDDEDVRLWAAVTLGKLGDERALEPLVKVVMNDNEKVKREAAGAVVQIVPSFDDVNIDEVIKKIESIYQEFATDKAHEEEKLAIAMNYEKEQEFEIGKQTQEKYFEELQKLQTEKAVEQKKEEANIASIEESTKTITKEVKETEKVKTDLPPPAMVVPTSRPIAESVERETESIEGKKSDVPEVSINEFMSALRKGTIEERVDELSNVVARTMDLFVTAIDDISMRLTNLENRIEQNLQSVGSMQEGVPAILPTLKKVPTTNTQLKAPTPINVLPTRAALNEELKKVLNKRKVEG
ncbi:MAG: HEAT repeat domain-containing protein [Candidatus Helarchaeota archaeon]